MLAAMCPRPLLRFSNEKNQSEPPKNLFYVQQMRLFFELEKGRDFLRVVILFSLKFSLANEFPYAFVIQIKFNSPFISKNS